MVKYLNTLFVTDKDVVEKIKQYSLQPSNETYMYIFMTPNKTYLIEKGKHNDSLRYKEKENIFESLKLLLSNEQTKHKIFGLYYVDYLGKEEYHVFFSNPIIYSSLIMETSKPFLKKHQGNHFNILCVPYEMLDDMPCEYLNFSKN